MTFEGFGDLSKLLVSIRASADEYSADLKKIQRDSKELERSLKPFQQIGGIVAGAFAAAAAAAVAITKKVADYGDEINDARQRTGLMATQLSGLKYAAELSGTSFEGLTTGLKNFARISYEASQGQKEQAEAFQAIGVSTKDSTGKIRGMNELLLESADRFSVMVDGVEKAALAQKLFGKAGTELIPLLNEGSAGINKLTAEAHKLGLVIDDEAAANADKFNDTLRKLTGSIEGIAVKIGNAFIPVLTNFASFLAEAVSDLTNRLDPFSQQLAAMEAATKKLAPAAKQVVDIGAAFKDLAGINLTILSDEEAQAKALDDLRAHIEMLSKALEAWGRINSIAAANSRQFHSILEGDANQLAENLQEIQMHIKTMTDQYVADLDRTIQALDILLNLPNMSPKVAVPFFDPNVFDPAAAEARKMADEVARAKKEGEKLIDVFTRDVSHIFTGWIANGKGFWQSFKDLGKNAIASLADTFLQTMIKGFLQPFAQQLGGLAMRLSGVGGGLSSGLFAGGGLLAGGGLNALGGAIGIQSFSGTGLGLTGGGLIGLASNPFTIAAAGGIAAAVAWIKSQAHHEASTFVKNFQDPFANTSGTGAFDVLFKQFRDANAAGTLTKDSGMQMLQAAQSLFATFNQSADEFARRGSDEALVVKQAHATIDPIIKPILDQMLQIVENLPGGPKNPAPKQPAVVTFQLDRKTIGKIILEDINTLIRGQGFILQTAK